LGSAKVSLNSQKIVPNREFTKTLNAAEEILRCATESDPGGAVAICFKDEEITYSALAERVNRIGNGLKSMGFGRGDRVLIIMHDSPDLVCAYLAVMKIGAIVVALNVRSSEADLRFALADTGCRCLIADEALLPMCELVLNQFDRPPTLIAARSSSVHYPTLAEFLTVESSELDAASLSADDMAFWVYTSGTTGTPRAAVHQQHNVLTSGKYLAEYLDVRHGDRIFASSKLFFAYALNACLFGALSVGATIVLHDAWCTPEAVADLLKKYKPTVFFSVPVFYRNLLCADIDRHDTFKSVRVCVSAGERLPVSISRRWRAETGLSITEGYGTSECLNMVLSNRADDSREGAAGKICSWVNAELREMNSGRVIVEAGETGVLWVATPSLCAGYWKQQSLSADAFRDGWFCTGDFFTFDSDGYFYYQGRADDMLKISGQWVSPAEIEEAAQMPEVAEAVAVGRSDDDGITRLALFVVPRDPWSDYEQLACHIRDRLRAKLAGYKCPRNIYFLKSFPVNSNGKVQRHLLRSKPALAVVDVQEVLV